MKYRTQFLTVATLAGALGITFVFQNCGGVASGQRAEISAIGEASGREQVDPSASSNVSSPVFSTASAAEEAQLLNSISNGLTNNVENALNDYKNGNGPLWTLIGLFRTSLSLYKATGNKSALLLNVDHGLSLLEMTGANLGVKDYYRNRSVQAWMMRAYTCGKPYAHLVHNMAIVEVLAESAFALSEISPGDRVVNRKVNDLVLGLDKVTQTFDEQFLSAGGYYKNPAPEYDNCEEFRNIGKIMPLNMESAAGLAHFQLAKHVQVLGANRADVHEARSLKLARKIKSLISYANNNGKLYNKWSYIEGGRNEDITHAYLTVRLALSHFASATGVFTRTDMVRFSNSALVFYNDFDQSKVRRHLALDSALTGNKGLIEDFLNFSELCQFNRKVLSASENLYAKGFRGLLGKSILFNARKVCANTIEDVN